MLSRSECKYIQSLYHKKQRDAEGLFIAEGVKVAEEVLQSHYKVHQIYATEKWLSSNKKYADKTIIISDADLQRISAQPTPNNVLMLVHTTAQAINNKVSNNFFLALDGIQDPGNFGTIIRIADWFGIDQIICSNDCVELYNPKVIQSTMGSFTRVSVGYTHLPMYLANCKTKVFGAMLNGTDVATITKPQSGIIVIGNEGRGIREDVLPTLKQAVSIKRFGGAESLNAAVATGIILSHFK